MISVTIVIPILNARPWISATLDSIRAQTYPLDRIETIVVDAGSGDESVGVARDYLERHCMLGQVIAADAFQGASASRNRGWQAATGEWIQFLDSDDVLAPNKIELQSKLVARLPDVISSSWQRLVHRHDAWQPAGPSVAPDLVDPLFLRLVSPHAGLLGPALIRKKALEAVGGFSDGVARLDGGHVLLKFAALGNRFVEAPSEAPLLFVRHLPGSVIRSDADLARQHLQNVVIAEAMLRQRRGGLLKAEDKREIAHLCEASLGQLYAHDWAAFQQHWQWLREINPAFVPQRSRSLKLASKLLGYESAEGVAAAVRRARSSPVKAFGWLASRLRGAMPEAPPGVVRNAMHSAQAAWDGLLARAGGGYRLTGAAALLAVAGVTVWAGAVALSELVTRPAAVAANARLAQAPSRSETAAPSAQAKAKPLPVAAIEPPRTDSKAAAAAAPTSATPSTPAQSPPRQEAAPAPAPPAKTKSAAPAPAEPPRPASSSAAAPVSPPAPIAEAARSPEPAVAAPAPTKVKPEPATPAAAPPRPSLTAAPVTAASRPSPAAAARSDQQAAPAAAATPAVEVKAVSMVPSGPVAAVAKATPAAEAANPVHTPARVAETAPAPILSAATKPEPPQPTASATQAAAPAPLASRDRTAETAAPRGPAEAKTAALPPPEPPRPGAGGAAFAVSPAPAMPAKSNPITVALPPPVAPVLTAEEREQAEKMITRGERYLEDGNIAAARQFFQRAATAGHARGALLLATTYDAYELARMRVLGLQPNVALARKWYERARELGADEAQERLTRLPRG